MATIGIDGCKQCGSSLVGSGESLCPACAALASPHTTTRVAPRTWLIVGAVAIISLINLNFMWGCANRLSAQWGMASPLPVFTPLTVHEINPSIQTYYEGETYQFIGEVSVTSFLGKGAHSGIIYMYGDGLQVNCIFSARQFPQHAVMGSILTVRGKPKFVGGTIIVLKDCTVVARH